ncbi:hypothetical protein ACS0TY_036078 [Phlomoides rotata]
MPAGTQSSRGRSSDSEEDNIRVCFKSQDGSRDFFKVLESTKIRDLVKVFCARKNIEYETAVFLYDQKCLPYKGTVKEVGLMDKDEINVMIPHSGG